MATQQAIRKGSLDRYGSPTDLPSWITSDWLNVRINDGQREIAERTECIVGSAGVSGTSTKRSYARPQTLFKIHSVEWRSHGELEQKSYDYVRTVNGDTWRTATGTPQYWYKEDDRTFSAYPKVQPGSAGTFYAYGPKYPTDLVNNTSPSEIPTSLNRALEEYVCHQIESVTVLPEGKQAGTHLAAYENEMGKYKHVRPEMLSVEAPRK